jgi:23S rRNA pseudouridine2605 synthase
VTEQPIKVDEEGLVRLQKLLAAAGVGSRRRCEELMLDGLVEVDGEVVTRLGTKVDPRTAVVRVDGRRLPPLSAHVYLVLNKPRGVVSTRSDPERRKTVMDLVPRVAGLFPVGRLDVTTEGLILLTNDGVFAERVAHPRYEVQRVYHAKVHGVPDASALERLRRGLRVDGDFMAVDRARVVEADNNAWVELVLHEGKQHEVKRLLEAVGHPVSKLRRVAIGPVTSRGLEPGQFRALSPEEIEGLRRGDATRAGALGRLAGHRRARARARPPAAPVAARGALGRARRVGSHRLGPRKRGRP